MKPAQIRTVKILKLVQINNECININWIYDIFVNKKWTIIYACLPTSVFWFNLHSNCVLIEFQLTNKLNAIIWKNLEILYFFLDLLLTKLGICIFLDDAAYFLLILPFVKNKTKILAMLLLQQLNWSLDYLC